MLYDSLRSKIMPLADDVIVYPGHGAGSACGKNLSEETWGYLGDQKATNYALRENMTREEFVQEVTAGLKPPPQYFAKNAMMNKAGYSSFDEVLKRGNVPLSVEEFENLAEHEEALMLDTRHQDVFTKEHIPNSIFIGIDDDFAPWVGALIVDIKQPIIIIAEVGKEEEVVTRLSRVGYDNALGYLDGGFEAWKAAGKETDSIESITPEVFAERVHSGLDGEIMDVRTPSEYVSHRVQNAFNYPLDYINNNMDRLDRGNKYYLYCFQGYRSMITSSILRARGFRNIVNVREGFEGIEKSTTPLTNYVCPTEIPQEKIDEALMAVV